MRKELHFKSMSGIQKRLAVWLLKAAMTYETSLKLHYSDRVFDARQLINQLIPEVPSGDDVTLVAEGKDAKAAVSELEKQMRKEEIT